LLQDEHDESSKIEFRPDVTGMNNGALFLKVESKNSERLMNKAKDELVEKFHIDAMQLFPRGSQGILGITSCPTLINVYEIYFLREFKTRLLGSFQVSYLSDRSLFLNCWFNIICWVAGIQEPNRSFHLPYNVRWKTPNNHHVTWKGDVVVKEFHTTDEERSNRIRDVYERKLPNVEWGKVDNNKVITIHRIGRRLEECLKNRIITKNQIWEGVVAGVQQLHDMGFAHTDISITNVFVDERGVVFIDDLEYLSPVDAAPRDGYGRVAADSPIPTTARELDHLQLMNFGTELAKL
jgi:hypothetical protein